MKLTFEIYPSDKLDLDAIPRSWELSISHRSPSLQPALDVYYQLGRRPKPHISAALVESEDHLRSIAEIVTDKVFLIAGDANPCGPFQRAIQLIPYFQHCQEIGVAGYPEGHPSYPYQGFGDEILLEKQGVGATHVVTQLCFDPEAIIDWTKRVRDKGVTLPIYCGVAVPLNILQLMQFAQRCGVSVSLSFLKKMSTRDVVRMISRYDPRPLIGAVYEHVDGFHIYTFNAIKTTGRWLEETPWLEERVPGAPSG